MMDASSNLATVYTTKSKQMSEETQNYLLQTKDEEINELKERISLIER